MRGPNNSDGMKRRSVLKRMSVAGAGVAGLAGASSTGAAGSSDRHEVETKYLATGAVRSAFATHADDLLDELHARDLLDSPRPADLPVGPLLRDRTRLEAADTTEGTAVTSLETDDGRTALILTSVDEADYSMTMAVQPEAGKRYAEIEPKDGSDSFAIDPSTEQVKLDATTQECYDYTNCTSQVCAKNCRFGCNDEVWHQAQDYSCYRCTGGCCCYPYGDTYCALGCKCEGCCAGC